MTEQTTNPLYDIYVKNGNVADYDYMKIFVMRISPNGTYLNNCFTVEGYFDDETSREKCWEIEDDLMRGDFSKLTAIDLGECSALPLNDENYLACDEVEAFSLEQAEAE